MWIKSEKGEIYNLSYAQSLKVSPLFDSKSRSGGFGKPDSPEGQNPIGYQITAKFDEGDVYLTESHDLEETNAAVSKICLALNEGKQFFDLS